MPESSFRAGTGAARRHSPASRCGTSRYWSPGGICYVRLVSTSPIRDRLALGAAALAVLAAVLSLAAPWYDAGIQLGLDGDRVRVEAVDPLSQAWRDGIRPGMVVVSMNSVQLIRLPTNVYGEPNPDDPEQQPPLLGVDPPAPTPVVPINWSIEALIGQAIENLIGAPFGSSGTMTAASIITRAVKAARSSKGKMNALAPVARRIRHFKDSGLRVFLTARAQTQAPIRMPGRPIDYYRDSVVVSIALRNRS